MREPYTTEKKTAVSFLVGCIIGLLVLGLLLLGGCVSEYEISTCRARCAGRTPARVTWVTCTCNPATYGEPGDQCTVDKDCQSKSCLMFLDGKPGRCQ